MIFQEDIKALRISRHLTQEKLAKQLHVRLAGKLFQLGRMVKIILISTLYASLVNFLTFLLKN